MKRTVVVLCVLCLAACSTPQTKRMTEVAATPLNDLNLMQTVIPEPLVKAREHPYREPDDPGCAGLAEEIDQLDELLGPDMDVPHEKRSFDLIDRGSELASDAAMNAFKGVTEGVVPFRSWVRKLSGAERYSSKVSSALAAGKVRRGFLKGVRMTRGCQPDTPPAGAQASPEK
jgi:hypothetical protein